MKRRELIKKINSLGFFYLRDGGKHDIYSNGRKTVAIKRHKEFEKYQVIQIIKECKEV